MKLRKENRVSFENELDKLQIKVAAQAVVLKQQTCLIDRLVSKLESIRTILIINTDSSIKLQTIKELVDLNN